MPDEGWVRCPSVGLTPLEVPRSLAADGVRLVRCPRCAWTFPTTMDAPLLPVHYLHRDTGDVMVRPTHIVDLR